MEECNNDLACVWSQDITGATTVQKCQPSICGRLRAVTTCNNFVVNDTRMSVNPEKYNPCFMVQELNPAICRQQRCPEMNAATCQATAQQHVCDYVAERMGPRCRDLKCQYTTSEQCEMNAECYFNNYDNFCTARVPDCVLSGFSDWAPCSSSCGPSTTYKQRSILQFPTKSGMSCEDIARAEGTNCKSGGKPITGCDTDAVPKDTNITVTRSCAAQYNSWVPPFPGSEASKTNWPGNCSSYCSIKTRDQCLDDNSCRWIGATCQVTPFMGCVAYTTQAECDASDMCAFDSTIGICNPQVKACPYDNQKDCNALSTCAWRTGDTSNAYATAARLPVKLVSPGQTEIYPFMDLWVASSDKIHGATVTIETNYQRGKDLLDFNYGKTIHMDWYEESGTLRLYGEATVTEYSAALRFVMFTTTSTRVVARRVSWSFGNNTMYSSSTGHYYRMVSQLGASWSYAKHWCSQRSFSGLAGYLATITSAAENEFVTLKVEGHGWIGGEETGKSLWKYSSGPEAADTFWQGGSATLGGIRIGNLYSNWSPPNNTNFNGEPIINVGSGGTTGLNRAFLAESGYWESRLQDALNVVGFVCEFGGLSTDATPPYTLGAAVVIGTAGCVPQMCIWHTTALACSMDVECMWSNGQCVSGCSSRSTSTECSESSLCKWDTDVLPATCDINVCTPLSMAACTADTRCQWNSDTGVCVYRTGCERFERLECISQATCSWSGISCKTRTCDSYTNLKDCRSSALCTWDTDKLVCKNAYCMYGSKAQCDLDKVHCIWNDADSVSMGFIPGGTTILPFSSGVEAPADITTRIDGMTVIISEGYQKGLDFLSVNVEDNVEQNYLITFDADNGVLLLKVNSGVQINALTGFNFLKKYVRFSTESSNPIRRRISYALALYSFYSPDASLYFRWEYKARSTTFSDASSVCTSASLFGMPGALAAIQYEGDNILFASLQASGWIAATGNAQSKWSWSTPRGSIPFWTGKGALGVPLTNVNGSLFARWGNGEPAIASAYGFFQSSGQWKAIADNASPAPVGVLCQYGHSQMTTVAISGYRNVVPAGCFIAPCLTLTESECKTDPTCTWATTTSGSTCVRETTCSSSTKPASCKMMELCYWDYSLGACISQKPTICSVKRTSATCATLSQCEWNNLIVPRTSSTVLGACVFKGCAMYPASSTCSADPLCQWYPTAGPCVARLCGYQTEDSCWRDNLCVWKRESAFQGCTKSPCISAASSIECNAVESCAWGSTDPQCLYTRCAVTEKYKCLNDTACVFVNSTCQRPVCDVYVGQAECKANPLCYFSIADKKCLPQQCISHTTFADCEKGEKVLSKKACIWVSAENRCRQPTYAEQHAPTNSGPVCEKEKNPNMWWLWLFLVVILILLGAIVHRLYLAYSKGRSFFEPTKKNYIYNPHQMYAKDLFEEAKIIGQETNVVK